VTLSLPTTSFITLLEPEYLCGFLLRKYHPTRTPLRRMSIRILRMKRPVSLHRLTSFPPTHLPRHPCPRPRIFRLNDFPFFICRRCFKAPRRLKSTQSSTHSTSTSAQDNSSARYQTDDSVPLRRFQLIAWFCKSSFRQEIVGPYPDAGILV
jgi:hypothetical protein